MAFIRAFLWLKPFLFTQERLDLNPTSAKQAWTVFFFYLLLLFCDERVVSFVFVVLGIYLAATTNCSNICDKKSTRLLETERRPQVCFFVFSLPFLLDSCHYYYLFIYLFNENRTRSFFSNSHRASLFNDFRDVKHTTLSEQAAVKEAEVFSCCKRSSPVYMFVCNRT